ncbi:MAG: PUR family DNA/RNA-binding protein [Psychroflexus sp.]|jgi:hypothetical protein|nr:PUR family DNA/RNA-binding protein [Psychroflexus sp.]MDR9449021.1 PUR family DNA/RNA-binding protein [Psychroflexus sp.]
MSEQGTKNDDIYAKVIRAGRRTYFFDVRSTKADDYYLTITESKKFTNEDGSYFYKKHKIYLYKEDFEEFKNALQETTDFIIEERGREVISDKHQPDFEKQKQTENENSTEDAPKAYTDVEFEDI